MRACTLPNSRPLRRTGFTLIELMVSMVFLLVVMLIMVQLLADTNRTWTLNKRRGRAGAIARSVLDLAAQELAQARISEEFPLVTSDSGVSFWMNQHAGDNPYGGPEIRGLTRVAYQATGSGDFSVLQRGSTNWVAGASRPTGSGAPVEVYPLVRQFRVTPLGDNGAPLGHGTHTTPPAALVLFLELAIADDAEVFGDMPAEQQIRALRRYQQIVSFPASHGERRLATP